MEYGKSASDEMGEEAEGGYEVSRVDLRKRWLQSVYRVFQRRRLRMLRSKLGRFLVCGSVRVESDSIGFDLIA
jgi:hypothetical protein